MNRDLEIRVLGAGGQGQIRILGETSNHPDLPISPFHFPAGHKALGRPEGGRVQVSLSQVCYMEVVQHARSGVNGLDRKEVGGILLGRPYRAADGRSYHVAVEHALPDRWGTSRATTFDFTHESWAALTKEAEERHPDLRIVGWYHSHPGYNAFFSPPDRHSQLTYFNTPWRVGLVVDPIYKDGKFFVATDNEEVVELPGFYERLGQNGQSIIAWRYGIEPGRSIEPPASAPAPAAQTQLSRWNRAMTGVAILWAIVVSVWLLIMVGELNRMQKELDALRPAIQELNTRSTPAPPARPTPAPQPSPTVSHTRPPTEPAPVIFPELPLPTRPPRMLEWWR